MVPDGDDDVMELGFRVLGRLEIVGDDGHRPLGSVKQRQVLALLLVNANGTVTVDQMLQEIWPGEPPRSAVANVRTYVAGLRAILSDVDDIAHRLSSQRPGYLLSVQPGELDLHRFDSCVAAAREARNRGDSSASLRHLDSALALWRGPAFEGVDAGRLVGAHAAALEGQRLDLVDDRALARLEVGDVATAVAELRLQVARHPLREASHALLIRALYLGGGVAGALAAYADARQILTAELGIEPSEKLQRIHLAVLSRDEAWMAVKPQAGRVAVEEDGVRWRRSRDRAEIPSPPAVFVGRDHLTQLIRDTILQQVADQGVPVVAAHGPAGVGTSALAYRVAWDLRRRFPDGRWYADFGGLRPEHGGPCAADVLARFLRGIGLAHADIPADVGEAGALFRACLSGRRVLLVLDNVAEASQIRPLLPAQPGCAALITSRRTLAALETTRQVAVPPLSAPAAVRLLTGIVSQCAADPKATAAIARLCCYLPIALRAAAARLAGRYDRTAADLLRALSDPESRLDELESDEVPVRACLSAGYLDLVASAARLQRHAARLFRAAGAAGNTMLSTRFAAQRLAVDETQARRVLDQLVRERLVQPLGGEIYLMDDLMLLRAKEVARRGATA